MKHVIVSEAELYTGRDLAAFIANAGEIPAETALTIASELIRNGWVSVIRIDPAPATP